MHFNSHLLPCSRRSPIIGMLSTVLSTQIVGKFIAHTQRWSSKRTALPILWFAALLATSPATAGQSADDAASYLNIQSVEDGRCQILSQGGKLVLITNTHATKRINYRLLRVFAAKPQGLTTGLLAPNGVAQKLGCDKVDGRAQTWQIKRARFVEE
jgi:hypothetical protein